MDGSSARPNSLIINSAFLKPVQHWERQYDRRLVIKSERRPAGYEIFDARNNTLRVEQLALVNTIRDRVDQWRDVGWPGVTIVTRKLLEHWHDKESGTREHPFYFCQLEAIETLIWWVEGTEEFRQGIAIPGDGGPWERLCNKMATGAGKTMVMAMIITWQVLNALTYPKRAKDFSQAIFIVAPGLTVKDRLRVLHPGAPDNAYDAFRLCPSEVLRQKLNQAEILIENWHSLMPARESKRSVVKRGAESDEAFTRRVLGKLTSYRDIVVINDEAHHAYRKPPELKISRKKAAEQGLDLDEATRWVEGLDRLHKTRRIQRCFDLSATPFAPTGKANTETALFDWIVSDFGLNDAIEGGLVKTPRVVVRDDALPDAKTLRPKLYHIYRDPSVSEDFNRRAQSHEPLPKLVQDAYTLLGADWRQTFEQWDQSGHHARPVMLTVCNRTETAARVEHYFNQGDAHWPELHAPERTLRVDSKVLEKAEIGESAAADKHYAKRLAQIVGASHLSDTRKEQLKELKKEDLLREIVDTVGKRDGAGQALQNVISVAMLSEGWDAKNVTHIMGLRAFTSQLLCEQVIGRGLRRVSYDSDMNGLFVPEYVNVFGVPLSISEQIGEEGEAPPPPKPSTQIEVVPERAALEIRWPNILRIEAVVRPTLSVDWTKVGMLTLDPALTPISAELAPALGGAADMSKVLAIHLEKLPDGFRLQRFIFQAARKGFATLQGSFAGSESILVLQLIRLVENFLLTDRLSIPSLFHSDPLRRRILIALNIDQVVQHLIAGIVSQNTIKLTPVYDEEQPIGATGQIPVWYTTKPNTPTIKSHVSHVVGDSAWEQYAANIFENHPLVAAYVKNDHLGFQIHYMWGGSRRRYLPDFLVRFTSGKTLVLEIKGEDSPQNKAKHAALDEWGTAVNGEGGFGSWAWDVAFKPAQVHDIVARHAIDGAEGIATSTNPSSVVAHEPAAEMNAAGGTTAGKGGANRRGPVQSGQGGRRDGGRGGGGGAATPPERGDECHFHAEMPLESEIGRVARIEVTVALEEIQRLPGPTSQQTKAEADPDRDITVQVLPRANCHTVGEDNEDWARIPVPGPRAPARLVFNVRGIVAGPAEVWVEARQGAVTLTQLRLQPVFIPARDRKAVVAVETMAEVSGSAQAAGNVGAQALIAFGTQAPVGRDHLVLRIFEVPCINGRFRLHFNLDCRDPAINVNKRTEEFDFSREDFVATQYGKLEEALDADGADYDRLLRRLRARGTEIYDSLVPEEVRAALWRHRAEIEAVQVISEEPFIPWEIAYLTDPMGRETDGEGFLGERGIVRWLHSVSWPRAELRLRPDRVRFAIPDYPEPSWRLPGAVREAGMLQRLFPGAQSVPARSDVVEDLLSRGDNAFDVLHFACHGEAEGRKIWDASLMMTGRMAGAEYKTDPLEVAQVRSKARLGGEGAGPTVFVNACQTGRAGRYVGRIGGFAEAFLAPKSGHGAGLFVGTLWSVGDGSALTFAEAFYKRLLAGDTLVAATRAAREEAKKARDPTWLAYTVYGHPLARVVSDDQA